MKTTMIYICLLPCFILGGAVYSPALTDFTFMVKVQLYVYRYYIFIIIIV